MRIVPMVVAIVCVAPLVHAEIVPATSLLDTLQSDPGAIDDAGDNAEDPTFLGYVEDLDRAWMRGALIAVDDPVDVYSVYAYPNGASTVVLTVDPDVADLDVVLHVVGPGGQSLTVDEQGIGQAEVAAFDDAEPSWTTTSGLWILTVAMKDVPDIGTDVSLLVRAPGVRATQSATDEPSVDLYSLRLDCHPQC